MPDDYRILKVLQSVQSDPSKTVLELARLVNLSRSRLGHLFRVQVGTDLDSFLRDARLEKAAELLQQTGSRSRRLPAGLVIIIHPALIVDFNTSLAFRRRISVEEIVF